MCFVAAAEQGYSKAQFNAGVCYEKGRGVQKDKEKVIIEFSTGKKKNFQSSDKSYCLYFVFQRLFTITGWQPSEATKTPGTAMQSFC